GSGKCGIVPSTDCANVVWGRLFGIDDWDLVALDRAEGAGSGYERTTVVALAEGASVEAVTYVATRIDTDLPYEWYKRFVLAGAREARLPGAYIAWLEEVSTVRDPDDARRRTQLQLQAEIHGSPPP
ncbi:MAG: gamma-glutamylcyclotransferase, partial [Candidatus Bipolaricaulia bacterium]